MRWAASGSSVSPSGLAKSGTRLVRVRAEEMRDFGLQLDAHACFRVDAPTPSHSRRRSRIGQYGNVCA